LSENVHNANTHEMKKGIAAKARLFDCTQFSLSLLQ